MKTFSFIRPGILLLSGLLFLFGMLPAGAADASGIAALSTVAPVVTCQDLMKVDLTDIGGPGSRVTGVSEENYQGHPACIVNGTLAPSIGFRVILPRNSWQQRYLQIGCGGLCGNISGQVGAAEGCVPLTNGAFVIAATDMGHEGNSGTFGRDIQKRADFAYRGQHLTAVAAKKLIKTFYGQPQKYAYFSGCSDGGREAMMEAERFPHDFNGVIAGAPAMIFQVQNSLHHGWLAESNTDTDGKPIITMARLPLIHNAVLKKCDALDGLKDGLISDPRVCHFDPVVLQCKNPKTSDDPKCLSAKEVAAVRKFYEGPRDPKTGVRLTIAEEMPGSELAWAGIFVPMNRNGQIFSKQIALDALKNMIFAENPPDSFTLKDLKFNLATFRKLRAHHPLFDAINPDLSAFKKAGGKLILWHGWADPHITPVGTVAYQEALLHQMGQGTVQQFERLYLFPGLHHCGGGEGPHSFDLLTPMMEWVEKGQAPDAIMTSQSASGEKRSTFGQPDQAKHASKGAHKDPHKGPPPEMLKVMQAAAAMEPKLKADRARPVYPYPSVAIYNGKGDPNKAGSFHRGKPLYTGGVPKWAGSDWFTPYTFAEK